MNSFSNFNLFVFCFLLTQPTLVFGKHKIDGIVAIVNSEPVLESDLNSLIRRAKQPGVLDEMLAKNGDLSGLQTDRDKQLDYLVTEKILESEIKRLNLSVTDERVDMEVKDTAKKSGLSQADMIKALQNQGIDFETYKKVLKQKIERNSLFENEIVTKLRITDDEAFSEYQKRNPNAKSRVYEFNISHIYFNPKKDGAERTYARAERALKKLETGLTFEKAAEQFTEESRFSNGGFLGSFKSGEFSPEFEAAVQNLEEGGHTKIVKSKTGFHILKLNSKKMALDPQFEKEKERIKAVLFDSNFKRQLRTWLDSKRDDATIKYNAK